MIRIIICDDQEIVCEGLNKILGTDPEIEVLDIAHNGEEAIQQAQKLHPDLILMDLKMPVTNGIIATRKIHDQFPEIKILVLTTYDDDEWLFDAIRSGGLRVFTERYPPAGFDQSHQRHCVGQHLC